jgi:hypothetical protein
MEHTTFLQDLIGLLISVVIPLVLVLVLVIKNPQTTLSLIKAGFKLLVSAGKFIAPFIVPFLAFAYKALKTPKNDGEWYSYSSYSSGSDNGSSEKGSDWRYDYPTKRDNYKPYQ